ncbi:DNA-binding protein [Kaistia terrae]|uniref:XRE family transcriptional regulator n=1 Tax=Kaistia terrae TaxID=537017 RepID=A0ABW0PRJ2_9HYPH|nr:DNA-binding protein [Kaistia terrae]MCX5578303.1 DNA-binding protein [Kaistia terrae]
MNVVQCRMALAGLGWSVEDLAREAGVPIDALLRFDSGEVVPPGIYAALRDTLQDAGIIFEDDGQLVEGGPGVRLHRSHVDEGKRPEELSSANDG